MPEILTTDQLITAVLAILGILCTAIGFLVSYLLKGWINTQKEHGKIIRQVVIDMNSLKEVAQANMKAIGDMIENQKKAQREAYEGQAMALDRLEKGQERANGELISNLKLMMDYKILQSKS